MSSFKNESTHIAVHSFTGKGYWNGPYFVSSVASYLFYIHWVTSCSTERPHKNLLFMSGVYFLCQGCLPMVQRWQGFLVMYNWTP